LNQIKNLKFNKLLEINFNSFLDNKLLIQIISKINISKIWNAVLLFTSFHISRLFKVSIHWGMPLSIAVEPTTSCNLRCPECPSGLRSFTRPTGMLEGKLFEKIIYELRNQLAYLTFYFQGEPYLNPNFLMMVKYASEKNIFTTTSTNAHYLSPAISEQTVLSGLDKLIISLDGITQEIYENYRVGGKIDKVFEGTKNILDAKIRLKSKTPYIVFQYLVVKPNEHQINDAKKLAVEMGVDEIVFKTAQIYDFKNGSDLMPSIEKYSRYKKMPDGKFKIKNNLENSCWKMWSSAVITWDGAVVPCCFDKDAKHKLGSVQSETFKTIWKNNSYKSFRSSILKGRNQIDICKNCSEGTKVFGEA
jgi:radical SAM protein with 4Fe4S-binding SPASM domain